MAARYRPAPKVLQIDAACWRRSGGGSTAPVPRRREPRGVADSVREGSKGDADDDDDDDGVEEVVEVVVEEEEEAMRNDMMSDMPC